VLFELFKLVLAWLSLLPPGLALWLLTGRAAPRLARAESLLLSGLLLAGVVLAGYVALGLMPWGRPLDLYPALHALVSVVSAAWVVMQWDELVPLLRRAAAGARPVWRRTPGVGRGLVLLALMSHAGVAALGTWVWTTNTDELAYHLPQAVQPVVDGFVGPVHASAVWADSFPRGGALWWSASLSLVGTDTGFRSINAAFGLLMALSVFAALRRVGTGRVWSLQIAAATLTTPVLSYLCTIAYVDVQSAALLCAAIVFTLPGPNAPTGGARVLEPARVLGCALAAALAMWCKFLAVVVVVPLAVWWCVRSVGARRRGERLTPALGIAGVAALFAAGPYARSWAVYGSPVFPFQLRVGSLVLFDGPMTQQAMTLEPGTNAWERFARFWTDFSAELHPQSPGGLGPLFLLLGVPALLMLAGGCWARARRADAVLLLIFAGALLLPNHHWPRYTLWFMLPAAMGLGRLAMELRTPPARAGLSAALLALSLGNAWMFWSSAAATTSRLIGQGEGVDLLGPGRARAAIDRAYQPGRWVPSRECRAWLSRAIPTGDRVASALFVHPILLTDPRHRYSVEEWPLVPRPAYDDAYDALAQPGAGFSRAKAWLEELRRRRARWVLVYAGFAADQVLAYPSSGYVLARSFEARDGALAVRVYLAAPN
jgi:hypothetical protein